MLRVPLALAALTLTFAAPAAAQSGGEERIAPPGNSAIDEYMETLPSATGDSRPRSPQATPATPVLTPGQRRDLVREGGAAGEQLAAVVEATAPPVRRAAAAPRRAAATPAAPAPEPRSPLNATLSATLGANDGGGLGIGFPLLLAASFVAIVALAVRRRRLSL